VQARGRCNRDPKTVELSVITRWADDNNLRVTFRDP